MPDRLKVTVIEDNETVRQSIFLLCDLADIDATCYETAEKFLENKQDDAACSRGQPIRGGPQLGEARRPRAFFGQRQEALRGGIRRYG